MCSKTKICKCLKKLYLIIITSKNNNRDACQSILNIKNYLLNTKSEVTNSELAKNFDKIQENMEKDLELKQRTTKNIELISQNKVYPNHVKKAKKIDGLIPPPIQEQGSQNNSNNNTWNNRLSLFLRLLRQFLNDNGCELKVVLNQSELQQQQEVHVLASKLLTLNDQTNFKYCVTFKNFKYTFQQLNTQTVEMKNEINYICDLIQWSVVGVTQIQNKEKVDIINICQSPNSQNDLEVHFVLLEDDISLSAQTINFDALSNQIQNTVKNGICNNIEVCSKKVTKIITVTYNYFLREYSRGWENIAMTHDYRGIKNGQKQEYYFPFSWFGFAVDVQSLDENDTNWLSMEEGNLKSWAVGYLPANLTPLSNQDRLKYSDIKDRFTNSQIGSAITIYRDPKEMEEKCSVIQDPISKLKYKIGYLCRVNIDTLKCPADNQNIYVVNKLNEIRIYRLLLKQI